MTLAAYAQWTKQTAGLPESWRGGEAIDACDAETAVISILSPSSLYRTLNGGDSWQSVLLPEDCYSAIDVSVVDGDHFWIAGSNGAIYATINEGVSWILQFHDTTQKKFINYVEMFDSNNGVAMGDCVDPTNNPTGPAIILQTLDGG